MIKIVKVPLQLEPFLNIFEDLFTKPSYCSFRDLCGALSVCDKSKTVANLCDTMADCSKDRKSTRLNSSHIPLSRMPSSA